ncbi:fimbrial protein [Neisseriaceae bacterium CLB008]
MMSNLFRLVVLLFLAGPTYAAWEICPGPSNYHAQRIPAPHLETIASYTPRGSIDLNTQQTAYEIVVKEGNNGQIELSDKRLISKSLVMEVKPACNTSGTYHAKSKVEFVPEKGMGDSGQMQVSTASGLDLTFKVMFDIDGQKIGSNPTSNRYGNKFGLQLEITKIRQTGPIKGGGEQYQRIKVGHYKLGVIEEGTGWDGAQMDIYLWIKVNNHQQTCKIVGSSHVRADLKPIMLSELMARGGPVKGGVSGSIKLSCPKNLKVAAILTDPYSRQVVSDYLNSSEDNGVVFKLKRNSVDGPYLQFGPNTFGSDNRHQFLIEAKQGDVTATFDVYYALKPGVTKVKPGPVSGRAEITFSYQ